MLSCRSKKRTEFLRTVREAGEASSLTAQEQSARFWPNIPFFTLEGHEAMRTGRKSQTEITVDQILFKNNLKSNKVKIMSSFQEHGVNYPGGTQATFGLQHLH